jgi:hypothetical protein
MREGSFKAVAHVHSTWSYDGTLALEEIASTFGVLGYRAVLTSEHDRGFDQDRWDGYRQACAAASTRDVGLLPGIEYSDANNDVHVLVWGCESFLGEGRETASLLADVRAAGAVSVLAHPGRRAAATKLSNSTIALFDGIEMWNRKYDGIAPGEAGLGLLAGFSDAAPFVGLDFHTRRQLFPLTMQFEADLGAGIAGIVSAVRERRCSAQGFGAPVSSIASPLGLAAFRGAERTRRVTLSGLRSIRR